MFSGWLFMTNQGPFLNFEFEFMPNGFFNLYERGEKRYICGTEDGSKADARICGWNKNSGLLYPVAKIVVEQDDSIRDNVEKSIGTFVNLHGVCHGFGFSAINMKNSSEVFRGHVKVRGEEPNWEVDEIDIAKRG